MSSEACVSRLLVQAGPVLAFRLLEYYTPSKRILKKTMLSTWTLKKLTKEGVSICQKKKKKEVRFSVLSDSILVSCVTLGKLLNLSGLFPHL